MEEKIIRVAQIIGNASTGGVESCIMNYYRNIDRTKVQFDFFVENTSPIINRDIIAELGGKVVFIPSYIHPVKYMRTLTKLFKEGHYDIVHSNMNTLSVFALRAAKKAGIKIRIAHSHSAVVPSKEEKVRTFTKNILKHFSKHYATHYFACSEFAGRWLFGDKTFDEGKVTIVRNAVELWRFVYNDQVRDCMRKEMGLEGKFVVGHVGRFMKQKNQLFLLSVFKEILNRRPDAVLLILGDGPLHEDLMARTKELHIRDRVVFAGVHKRPERFFQAMDCFLLPSLYEGLGMVLIEAQINGLNCYASVNVPREAKVNDNVIFLPIKNAEEWADSVVSGEETNRSLGVCRFINSPYDMRQEAGNLLALYQKMVLEADGSTVSTVGQTKREMSSAPKETTKDSK